MLSFWRFVPSTLQSRYRGFVILDIPATSLEAAIPLLIATLEKCYPTYKWTPTPDGAMCDATTYTHRIFQPRVCCEPDNIDS